LCGELRIPLVVDIVEWYQPEDLPGGRFGPHAIANEISMRHVTRLADGVIAISRRLEQHYRRGGHPKVIKIPPLFDTVTQLEPKWSDADGRLHLCYAGSPVAKEALGLILRCLKQIHDLGVALTFHLVGMTASELAAMPEAHDLKLRDGAEEFIRFYGRVPNARAREIVAQSDFTVLLRPLRRANQFGFPSKLAESMSVGTPVIANDFSDLSDHLIDGRNAIFLPVLSREAVVDAFMRAAALTPAQRREMAVKALSDASRAFSPASVADALRRFLDDLV